MTNMATMPVYGKTFKNLLKKNQLADGRETWYVASGTDVLPSTSKIVQMMTLG